MKVEIWSDIACPWCYIGRRRFETALNQFEHPDEVEVIWRSFQLDPDAPRHYDGTLNDMLAERKGISHQQAEAMHQHVTSLAAEEGLNYRFDIARVGNSFDAHRLLHLAKHQGLQSEMKERIQKAYFTEGQSFGDHDTLVRLATEVGLDADETRRALETDAYAAEVYADIERGYRFGSRGVPYFVFDEKYGVSGAQRAEVFVSALQRTWADSHPVVELVGSDDAGVCHDDTCAV